VGFVGAWQSPELAAAFGHGSLAAGALAASLVTWFTFLPSFLFILAGGPLVESTHDDLKFTGPLTAITAAVVGVILNLALFFGYHVLWPRGMGEGFEWPAAMIALLALIALFRLKRGVIEVIAASALIGLAWTWWTHA
jgi:chromate transporter